MSKLTIKGRNVKDFIVIGSGKSIDSLVLAIDKKVNNLLLAMENNKKANPSDLEKEVNDDYSKNNNTPTISSLSKKLDKFKEDFITENSLPQSTIVESIQNQINSRLIDTKFYEKPKSKYHK